ncbi:hypothetical protein SARC_02138 [Sphaeroforma arctica JP610]|uniref:Uncharacterized protein n=1 Tax=Sphaeroforma arctica JP610 TaxID=667725 RepID=A0A0L0G9W0_9EUKA|nr:hypothetical protein SARC_02138 [Sphaeroforma arctica JP610]KNC85689.1 hypothetical protein SARC_02138 [Sphaeroforma arctica JP610]|eukprot:XP_014159591.1 hypothetical protein SARC_02138 [Sphaeroforma arctica JP610]
MAEQQQTSQQTPVERVANYQPVQNATGVASNLYSQAKESNQYVKRALEAGEGLLAQGSAVFWPYVQPGLQRLEPTANAQLDFLEEKAPQVQEFAAQKYKETSEFAAQKYNENSEFAAQKYNETSARAGEAVGAIQAQAGAAAEAVQARAADAQKAAGEYYNTTAQTVANSTAATRERATEMYDNTTKTIEENVDYYLSPASADDEKELALATEQGRFGKIFQITQKVSNRLYQRAAHNVTEANKYTQSLPESSPTLKHYVEVIERQKATLSETIASTQAFVLSSVQDASSTASAKLDDLRTTAAGQTALDIKNNLTSTVASLRERAAAAASEYKVPESINTSVNALSERLQGFYKEVKAGDDKLGVSERLNVLAEEAKKTWDSLAQSLSAYAPAGAVKDDGVFDA